MWWLIFTYPSSIDLKKYIVYHRDTSVAQSVKHLALDFSSGHDLMVMRSNPVSGSVLSMEPA